MRTGKLAPLVREYYPEYYVWEKYEERTCIPFKSVDGEYGILGNFAPTPLIVNGIEFVNAEQLFQILKFRDREILERIHKSRGLTIKMYAKSAEAKGFRRDDWGKIVIDVMKYCIKVKYDQSPKFREVLNSTKGYNIVEDQTRKNNRCGDTWGAVLKDGEYIGSNLMGRLLMELRNSVGKLEYTLPDDLFEYIQFLKNDENKSW